MKPVMQTVLGARRGNCFSACLASVFEVPIEEVPNFFDIAEDGSNEAWWAGVRNWLRPRGFGVIWLELKDIAHLNGFEGWFIVSGMTVRGTEHATVWRNGVMVHDPHPSQCGLTAVYGVDLLYPLDPARMRVAEASDADALCTLLEQAASK